MNKSESIAGLAAALAKAQGAMKGAVKDSTNPFFKSKYADLASVVEAIRVAFSNNGLSYIQTVQPSDKDEVRVETTLLHSSGEWVACGFLSLPVSKADAQGYGSALTYARRYSLSAAVGVAPEDDDGNAAVAAKPKATIAPATGVWDSMSNEEQTFLNSLADEVRSFIVVQDLQKAVEHLESANLGAEEKIAIWTRFDSSERSAMKKHSNLPKKV